MSIKVNIRPTTSVYATYKNINYKIWNAIAEFVDNSTQSYFSNSNKLKETKYWKGLEINIKYDKDQNGEYFLEIRDNAFGMDFNDFKRAIILDSRPKIVGRSEFGMGLKTAACWFGMKWSVDSTMLGSDVRYRTTIDVKHLSTYKDEEIEVEKVHANPSEHGTVIRIWDLNKTLVGRQVGNTKRNLSGIYRKDLNSGEIKIYYNEEALSYEYPKIYTETNDQGQEYPWSEEFSFMVTHNDVSYSARGFVGIRETGSSIEAGFGLFKNGRAIVGGYDNNYRPHEVFGAPNSFPYQRVFGEVEMDQWPVVQTKDNFNWDDGLEDLFIEELKNVADKYAKKSEKIRLRLPKLDPRTIDIGYDLEKSGLVKDVISRDYLIDSITDNSNNDYVDRENEENHERAINDTEAIVLPVQVIGRTYNFTHNKEEYIFNMHYKDSNAEDDWLSILREGDKNEYTISWNIRHKLFSSHINDKDFVEMMTKFIFSMSLAETSSRFTAINGQIPPHQIRTLMNSTLNTIMGVYNNE